MKNIKQIAIAIDSFKGCASSIELAEAIGKGIFASHISCDVMKIPIADGGEGSVAALADRIIKIDSLDPLQHHIQASYGVTQDRALIEIAAASGLTLIKGYRPNILKASTYGTGILIADALKRGFRHFTLFLGGSATNDAALGMMEALGYHFYDEQGMHIHPCGGNLTSIKYIDDSLAMPELKESVFEIACDVDNPLYGPNGAAYVFAPQKGAEEKEIVLLDDGLKHIAYLLKKDFGKEIDFVEGAGAAGGAGGICFALLHATMKRGIDLVKDLIHFDKRVANADLIITGEGKMDVQTLNGKVPMGVLQSGKKLDIPVIALCGSVDDNISFNDYGFTSVFSIQRGPITLSNSMEKVNALQNIETITTQIIKLFAI